MPDGPAPDGARRRHGHVEHPARRSGHAGGGGESSAARRPRSAGSTAKTPVSQRPGGASASRSEALTCRRIPALAGHPQHRFPSVLPRSSKGRTGARPRPPRRVCGIDAPTSTTRARSSSLPHPPDFAPHGPHVADGDCRKQRTTSAQTQPLGHEPGLIKLGGIRLPKCRRERRQPTMRHQRTAWRQQRAARPEPRPLAQPASRERPAVPRAPGAHRLAQQRAPRRNHRHRRNIPPPWDPQKAGRNAPPRADQHTSPQLAQLKQRSCREARLPRTAQRGGHTRGGHEAGFTPPSRAQRWKRNSAAAARWAPSPPQRLTPTCWPTPKPHETTGGAIGSSQPPAGSRRGGAGRLFRSQHRASPAAAAPQAQPMAPAQPAPSAAITTPSTESRRCAISAR